MKKIALIILFLLLTSQQLLGVLTIGLNTSAIDVGILGPGEGSHFESANNVDVTITTDTNNTTAILGVEIGSLLTSGDGYTIPAGVLRWQGWWASRSGTNFDGASFIKGYGSPVAYKISYDPIVAISDLDILQTMTVSLGTQITAIPEVQPQGTYTTRITFTVTE